MENLICRISYSNESSVGGVLPLKPGGNTDIPMQTKLPRAVIFRAIKRENRSAQITTDLEPTIEMHRPQFQKMTFSGLWV